MSAFVTADLHLGHSKSLGFLRPNGERLRPFDSVEEMDEYMVDNWNRVVDNKSTVYLLGDAVIPRKSLLTLERLKGRKILIRGNHEILNVKEYCKYFEDVRGAFYHPCDSTLPGGVIMTHIPVHPSCLSGPCLANIHGHIHSHLIQGADGLPDLKYFNACVEHHDFTPVPFDTVKEYFKNNRYNE
jgi:calcineurin-like phosphoesterase family protein